jgi:hypothetical protein
MKNIKTMDPKILRLLQQHFVGKKINGYSYIRSIDYGEYKKFETKGMAYRFRLSASRSVRARQLDAFMERVETYFNIKGGEIYFYSPDGWVNWWRS